MSSGPVVWLCVENGALRCYAAGADGAPRRVCFRLLTIKGGTVRCSPVVERGYEQELLGLGDQLEAAWRLAAPHCAGLSLVRRDGRAFLRDEVTHRRDRVAAAAYWLALAKTWLART